MLMKPDSVSRDLLQKIKPTEIVNDTWWMESSLYILHAIVTQVEERNFKFNYVGTRTRFVPLSTKTLTKIIGTNHPQVIKALIKHEIIECDQSYQTDVVSKGYCLAGKYRKTTISPCNLDQGLLSKKLDMFNQKQREEQFEELKKLPYLVKWLLPASRIGVDYTHAWSAISHLRDFYWRLICDSIEDSEQRNKLGEELSEKLSDYIIDCQNLFHLKRENDKKGPNIKYVKGRLYSPLTNLMSISRRALVYDGDPMVSLDLKNSQPLHFLLLSDERFWEHKEDWSLYKLNPDLYHKIEMVIKGSPTYVNEGSHPLFIMYSKRGPVTSELSDNIRFRSKKVEAEFLKLVSSGELYEELSARYGGKYVTKDGIDPFGSRQQAKTSFFHMIYHNDKNRHSNIKPAYEQFKKDFPVASGLMKIFKKRSYKDFPVMLQTLEGEILLKIVTKAISRKLRDVPIYTVHDSVITPRRWKTQVLNVMEYEYSKIFGFTPKISVETNPDYMIGGEPISLQESQKGYFKQKVEEMLGANVSESAFETEFKRLYHLSNIPDAYWEGIHHGDLEYFIDSAELPTYQYHAEQLSILPDATKVPPLPNDPTEKFPLSAQKSGVKNQVNHRTMAVDFVT